MRGTKTLIADSLRASFFLQTENGERIKNLKKLEEETKEGPFRKRLANSKVSIIFSFGPSIAKEETENGKKKAQVG